MGGWGLPAEWVGAYQCLYKFSQVQSSIGKQAPLIFLNALLAQKKNTPANDVLPIINETVDVHFSTVKVRGPGHHQGEGGGRGEGRGEGVGRQLKVPTGNGV